MATAAMAAEGWNVADAAFRLSMPVRQNVEARYFIPSPSAGGWECGVFNSEGAEGSAAAIQQGDSVIGFRVVVPPAKTIGKRAYVYFKRVDGVKHTPAPEDDRPCKVSRSVRTVTTRAFTATEIISYFGELQKSAQVSYVNALGAIPADEKWQLPNKTHIAALLQWETLFIAEEDMELSFGSKQPNIAWAMAVDGVAVADWHASAPEKEGSFCAPVAVKKGLHTFQMLAIQRFGEQLPQVLVKGAKGIQPLKGVSAPDFPSNATVEFSAKDRPAAKFEYEWPRAFGSITTAKNGAMGNAVAFAKASAENAVFTGIDGKPLEIKDSTMLWEAAFAPGVRVGEYRFPARRRLVLSKQIFIRPRVTNAPNVLPFGKGLELDVAIEAANEADTVLKFADASISYRDWGRVLDMPPSVQPIDGKRRLLFKALPMDAFQKEGGKLPTAMDVNISFFSGRLPMAAPATVALIHPEDDAVTELTASGVRLYHGDTPATLVCSRLPKAPLAARRRLLDNDGIVKLQPPNGPLELRRKVLGDDGLSKLQLLRCLLLDSFTEDLFAPNASVPLDGLLAKHLDGVAEVGGITVGRQEGTSANVTMLASFGKLVASKPDMAVLLNGAAVAKGFGTPMEATAASLFMAQACIAHGILPVLVAMPPLPGVEAAAIREEALYLKEMATAMGVPIVDFYSKDVNGTANARQWYNANVKCTTATPYDTAREWLAAQLAAEIKQIINSDK